MPPSTATVSPGLIVRSRPITTVERASASVKLGSPVAVPMATTSRPLRAGPSPAGSITASFGGAAVTTLAVSKAATRAGHFMRGSG